MRKIKHNVEFLKWFFFKKNVIKSKSSTSEEDSNQMFNLMSTAAMEDILIFMRIFLYFANSRKGPEQEYLYRIVCHFLAVMWPDLVMSNIHHITRLGKKDDIFYFLHIPTIQPKLKKWLLHESKIDEDYSTILTGLQCNSKIERVVRYIPKMTLKSHRWDVFLFKILDDPTFNGINGGDIVNGSLKFRDSQILVDEPVED